MNKNRLYYTNRMGKRPTEKFNCWGATMFVLNGINKLNWIGINEMDTWLCENTEVVKRRKVGDILVLYDFYELEHTAVYMGNGKFFHKKGANNSEITDRRGVLRHYRAIETYYRRLK